MNDDQILAELDKISHETWRKAVQKCHAHIGLKLYNKTNSGAHCEQRLGVSAVDFYVEFAYRQLFTLVWKWQFEKYSIEEQMIRVIDSKISEEVRKYRVEVSRNKKTILVENEQLSMVFEDIPDDSDEADSNTEKEMMEALEKACENNEIFKEFISLKKQGLSYDDIGAKMNRAKEDLYQMQETISRRAKKNLKLLSNNK